MGAGTKIEWTEATWNPITGCTKISPGCKNCYAERMAKRLGGRYGYPADEPFRPTFHPDRLEDPLGWTKPRRIFVVSMGDLFHHEVAEPTIDAVFAMMAVCQHHTFQVLTKRPNEMAAYMTKGDCLSTRADLVAEVAEHKRWAIWDARGSDRHKYAGCGPIGDVSNRRPWPGWPLPNVWVGTTCENQEQADKRIPELLKVPARVRFLSLEPLLGPLDIRKYVGASGPMYRTGFYYGCIHWVVTGAETGPGARPMEEGWVRSIRDQCIDGKVPFMYKQQIVNGKKVSLPELDGKVWDEMPKANGG